MAKIEASRAAAIFFCFHFFFFPMKILSIFGAKMKKSFQPHLFEPPGRSSGNRIIFMDSLGYPEMRGRVDVDDPQDLLPLDPSLSVNTGRVRLGRRIPRQCVGQFFFYAKIAHPSSFQCAIFHFNARFSTYSNGSYQEL